MKEVDCASVGLFPDCDWRGQGGDEADLMTKAAEHAREVHGLTEADFTEDRIAAIRRHIRDV